MKEILREKYPNTELFLAVFFHIQSNYEHLVWSRNFYDTLIVMQINMIN